MNPIRHVRKDILGIRQDELARIAGVTQGTVSKWEKGELEPDRAQLDRIRSAVIDQGCPWNDRWFFEPPARPTAERAAS